MCMGSYVDIIAIPPGSDRFREKGMSDETVGDGTILVLRQRIFDRLRRRLR